MTGESWVLAGSKKVPRRYNEIVKNFESLEPDKREKLLQIFKDHLPEDVELAYKSLMDNLDLEKEPALDFLFDSLSIYMTQYRSGESVIEFLKDTIYDKMREFFQELLKLDKSLGITSKIAYLKMENPNNIASNHIITDFRPIYFKDPLMEVKYGLIKHTLSFIFRTGNKFKEVYFTLDRDDLKELAKLIERALNKEKTLEDTLKKNDIKLLNGVDL